jgi:hypothetical protein
MKQFKKGNAVICDDYGVGFVTKVSNNPKNKYPVEVEFQSDNSMVTYTSNGKSVIGADITLKHNDHDWRP